jgi:hypothetical protein
MYKIVGTDGRQYGPITAEQIRQWISEGRVGNRTPVLVDGAKDWTFIGLLPEFANCFATTPPTIAPPPAARGSSSLATWGLIFGILSWMPFCCCCDGFPFNLLGLIFSLIGLAQINRHPELYEGRGTAITGLVLSIINLLVFGALILLSMALNIIQPHNVRF